MYGPAPAPPLSVAQRFALIIEGACKAVGDAQSFGLPGPIALLIWKHLKAVGRRFARLAEMARLGTLRPPRRRPIPAEAAPERPKRPPRPKPLLRKSGYAWIVKVAQRATSCGSQLQYLLEDPAMIALIALDPRFAAILRPLCSALATTPSPGRLPPPPPPRTPRATREPKSPIPKPPRKQRAKKVRWWCAKPPRAGLIFSDESLN